MNKESYLKYKLDNKYGWQVHKPVFVKVPFSAFGKEWKPGEEFNWSSQTFREEDLHKIMDNVFTLFNNGRLHHDSAREVEQKVGDRLAELKPQQMLTLVQQLNSYIKNQCTTDKEFQAKKVKQSKILEKQRGLLRSWLYRNAWASDEFYRLRDNFLEES